MSSVSFGSMVRSPQLLRHCERYVRSNLSVASRRLLRRSALLAMTILSLVLYSIKFIIDFVNGIVNRTRVLVKAHLDVCISVVLFFGALALYLKTMPPTVLDGDS